MKKRQAKYMEKCEKRSELSWGGIKKGQHHPMTLCSQKDDEDGAPAKRRETK